MKIKKIIEGLSAMAIASAMSLSALAADEPENNTITIRSTDSQSGSTNVTYTVAPSYIVTIPGSAVINEEGAETVQTASISASNILLEDGQKVTVELTSASNTESGSTFTAKNGETSSVNYSITAQETVAVGDKVAEFTAAGEQLLTFTKTGGTPTVAGDHTEQLTFTIAVEDAPTNIPVTSITLSGTEYTVKTWGAWFEISAQVGPDNATNKELEWTCDSESTFIEPSSDTLSCTVHPGDPGAVTITVRAKDGSGVQATADVLVNEDEEPEEG